MVTEPAQPVTKLSLAAQRAWGEALIKTGTEHLDLSMVRNGRQTLKEAEMRAADKTQEK
jgi:hypothetical protein